MSLDRISDYSYSFDPVMQREPYIVYVKINEHNHITAINSSAFLTETENWIEIDRGYGDKHHHAQGNYFPKPIYNELGICRYMLVDGQPVERTEEEMAADYVAVPAKPSQLDIIEAQVTYTAMMTDTLLEG